MDWNQSTNPAAGPQPHDFWGFPGSFPERPGRGTDHVNLDAPFPFRFGPGVNGPPFGPQGAYDATGRRESCRGDECSSDEESQTPAASPGPDVKMAATPEAEHSGEKSGLHESAEPEKAADEKPPGEKPAGGAHGCRHGRRHHRHGPRGPHSHHGHEHFGHHGGPPFGGPPFFAGPFGGHFPGGPFHGPPPFAGRGRGGRGFGRRGGPFGFGFGPHEAKQAFAAAAMAAHQKAGRYIQSLGLGLNNAAAANADSGDDDDGSNDLEYFTPPVDVFETASSWVVHVAVPGAKKEDMGIHWQAERSVLAISGVVYRPGDEALQQGLVSSERKTGLFKREVRLPPSPSPSSSSPSAAATGKMDVDAKGIVARLEDGVLSITVPRVEKEWTDVLKVDIL
ncbi:hypothetical protein MAPG_03207 [Magnaporthiopsis poae ATCC 64411]|uniref:SHSP domain-containing protein n=1 Tax=Magnaporthiopsis poae (strain ATCC 64411 / 73-15) TaxID=644358 RepID=A0A0C4DTE1_MAGP6|nr:hypothetical protein MAPG_03207 [Magnaporthiopsis poae ATCC 64411]